MHNALCMVTTAMVSSSSPLLEVLSAGKGDLEKVMELFDELEPVAPEFMLGRWHGAEIPTGHENDGLLDESGWYGKYFFDTETVHPLVFWNSSKTGLFSVHPKRATVDTRLVPRTPLAGRVMQLMKPVLATNEPTARLRSVEFRGQVTAAMIYDHLPIIDVFRKIDSQRVMGVMDRRGDSQHFVFMLTRDEDSDLDLPPCLNGPRA